MSRRLAAVTHPIAAGVADLGPARGPQSGTDGSQASVAPPATESGEIAPEADSGAGDDDAPEWPDESVEAAMIAEQRERDAGDITPSRAPRPAREADRDDEAAAPLPQLDALIEKIPPNVRETLDELFRARFTSVQRVPKQVLKE